MLYGLYLSAQGAEAQSARLDVISNNLANSDTTGFKRDLAVFRAHQPFDVRHGSQRSLPGNLNAHSGGVSVAEVATDFANGPLKRTGNSLDVALQGPGFFQVGEDARPFLTRNGQFTLDAENRLVTADTGLAVLDDGGGAIQLPTGVRDIQIASDGNITVNIPGGEPQSIGRLGVVAPGSLDQLQKTGNSLYTANGSVAPVEDADIHVEQAHLEGSGVNPVHEMTQMIDASRAFEANVNMAKYQDESLARLIGTMQPR